tara:strand:+ start:1429 stop:3870 length:2442 start_codon:yes stop_codon:yes gene_type:complete
MAEVKAKVQKAALYKMISYKGIEGKQNSYTPLTAAARLPKTEKSIQRGMTSVMMGLNALGRTLNSIAINTQFMLEAWKGSIRQGIKDKSALLKQEEKTKKVEKISKTKKDKATEKQRKLDKRNKDEEEAEKTKPKPFGQKVVEGAKSTGSALFSSLLGLFSWLGKLIAIPVLMWIGNNPKKVQKLIQILSSIGKFVFNVVSFLGGMALDGIINFLENPLSLKGLFGVVQFLLGAVPLFAGLVFLKNPKLLLDTAGKVIGGLTNGLKNLFGAQGKDAKLRQFQLKKIGGKKGNFFSSKFGKIATGLGAGAVAAGTVAAAGGTEGEIIGAGAGAAGGQMLGAKLGEMSGIPGMGAVGGMIGTMAGGAVGKAIGPMLDPIIGPVKDFFGEISKIFNTVLSAIKDPLEDFFKTLGAFMSGILEVVEPHMPLIGKIISVGLQVMFAPLFLGIKALTAVMKLFLGDKGKDTGAEVKPGGGDDGVKTTVTKENATVQKGEVTSGNMSNDDVVDRKIQMLEARKHPGMEKWELESINNQIKVLEDNRETGGYPISDGSEPDPFGFAKGGWINGPQSGYPVSLDGKRTSFIGHGKEWVGRKAGGKAFVVPFDTPATKTDKGLTARRMGQAKRQGYSLPTAFDQRLRPYKAGGEIIKPKRKKGMGSWLKDTLNKTPQVRLAKWLGNKAKNIVTAKDEEGKPKGIMRWLAGAADQATGGFFDFDKQGHSMYQASGIMKKTGEIIDNAKQKAQEERRKKLQKSIEESQGLVNINAASGGGLPIGSSAVDDVPILIPGSDHMDADKYLKPKYGLIAEFLTDPVEFM